MSRIADASCKALADMVPRRFGGTKIEVFACYDKRSSETLPDPGERHEIT